VQARLQAGELAPAVVRAELPGSQCPKHGRSVEPFQHHVGVVDRVDAWNGVSECAQVPHDRGLGCRVRAIAIAAQDAVGVEGVDVRVAAGGHGDRAGHGGILLQELEFTADRLSGEIPSTREQVAATIPQ
jgi:hypothetical protein